MPSRRLRSTHGVVFGPAERAHLSTTHALASGSTTITVPLSPESWSSVNGRFGNADSEARFGFDKAILNVTRLGLTFGGGCSFGHGINLLGGRAEFALVEYAIR